MGVFFIAWMAAIHLLVKNIDFYFAGTHLRTSPDYGGEAKGSTTGHDTYY